ncbi:Zn-ribbon domain-containing OB-fold protein [Blastococcus sp. Marseille-P5729]|uniref:Zn-ribbon domain-containing OB-fold protein n=1 Tax=Blastococcus sp. Marseille-P5729 TaxID=2086582 RepID=UPI000D100A53|nr:OB-fold domain-containing protein [Blastococcus sp. Marseille-P5729]
MSQQLPVPEVVINPDAAAYWEGTTRGVVVLQRCDGCQAVIWHPRAICPVCWTQELSTFEASGRGTVYSWTRTQKGLAEYRDAGPYVLAYVELEEGPRVMTNLLGFDDDPQVGDAVTAVFDRVNDDAALLRFRKSG